jgi:hypothetical protein
LGSGQALLKTRNRAGTPDTFSWNIEAGKTDWSRVPKNCYATTSQGGGGVLANDVDFHAVECAIVVMPDGGQNGTFQQVVAIGPDGRLYHRAFQYGPHGRPPSWTSFAPVPGYGGNPNGINAKKIAIAAAKDGSAQVVIINKNDNLVYHAMRYANGTWSGFYPLDGAGGAPNFAARDVAITVNASSSTSPGNAQVIANGLTDGNVFYRVRWPAGNWSPFAEIPSFIKNSLPEVGLRDTYALAITANENGFTDIVATCECDSSGSKILFTRRNPDSNWYPYWEPVGDVWQPISASSDVAVTFTSSGNTQLMLTDSAGNAYLQEYLAGLRSPVVSTTLITSTAGRAVSLSPGATAGSTSQLLITRTFPQ